MADYLVLEEDGTSHLLTETGDALLQEESGVVPPEPPAPQLAAWHAGEFPVPAGTGLHTVRFTFTTYTELDTTHASYDDVMAGAPTYDDMVATDVPGAIPDIVVFFGANQPGNQTGVNLGVYFGMAYRNEANPAALLNHCWFQMPNKTGGNSHRLTSSCLWSRATPNGPATLDADIVSFGPGEFTLNFATVTPGRTVRYLALSLGVAGHSGGAKFLPASLDIGFRARSVIGLWGTEGTVVDGENDTGPNSGAGNAPTGSIFVGVGCGSYPVGGSGNLGAGVSSGYQYQAAVGTWSSSLAVPNLFRHWQTGQIINTITGSVRDCAPSGTTALTLPGDSSTEFTTLAAFDGESSLGMFSPPAALDGVSGQLDVKAHNPNLTDVQAVLWLAGAPYGTRTNARVPAVGFGVWTPDYQGSVFVDGDAQALYQSSERSWCASVGAAGAVAGVTQVEEGSKVRIQTTQVGGPAAGEGIVMFALGNREIKAVWIPQIYRRILSI